MTKLEQEALALLGDCPLGFHDDRVVTARGTTDRDVVEWVKRLWDLWAQLRAERALGRESQ